MKHKQKYAKWQIGSVIEKLLEESRWFRIEPHPYDVYEVSVKDDRPLPQAKGVTATGHLVSLEEWLVDLERHFGDDLSLEAKQEFSGYFYRGLTPSEAIYQDREEPEPDDENHTEILQHRIAWWLRGNDAPQKLDDCSIEHIEKLIKEGYNQGELCVLGNDGDTEYRGWWRIAPAS